LAEELNNFIRGTEISHIQSFYDPVELTGQEIIECIFEGLGDTAGEFKEFLRAHSQLFLSELIRKRGGDLAMNAQVFMDVGQKDILLKTSSSLPQGGIQGDFSVKDSAGQWQERQLILQPVEPSSVSRVLADGSYRETYERIVNGRIQGPEIIINLGEKLYSYNILNEEKKTIGQIFFGINDARQRVFLKRVGIDNSERNKGYATLALALMKSILLSKGLENYSIVSWFRNPDLDVDAIYIRKAFAKIFQENKESNIGEAFKEVSASLVHNDLAMISQEVIGQVPFKADQFKVLFEHLNQKLAAKNIFFRLAANGVSKEASIAPNYDRSIGLMRGKPGSNQSDAMTLWSINKGKGVMFGYSDETHDWLGYGLFTVRTSDSFNVRFQIFTEYRNQGKGQRMFSFLRTVLVNRYQARQMVFPLVSDVEKKENSPTRRGLEALGFKQGERPDLMVYDIPSQNGKPGDLAMNADVQRNLELEELASEAQKGFKNYYASSGKWFLPYAMAGLQPDLLKAIMREAFNHIAYGTLQSFPFVHDDVDEHDQISRGMDKVISSGEKNIVISSIGPGEAMEEPMNVLRVVLEKLSRLDDNKGYTIAVRVYDRSADLLSEHQKKLPVEINKVLIEFPRFQGYFKAQVYYGDITKGHAEDTRRWEQMILPSNFIVWRNTWVMDQGLSIDDVRAFADVLQQKIRGEDQKGAGALIVQEYNPRGVDQETLKNPLFHGLVNRVYGSDGSVLDLRDLAMNGGIDLTPDKMNLQTRTDSSPAAQNDVSQGIKFHLDAAQLLRLQNAPGFVPVIINVQPLKSLTEFLEIASSMEKSPDVKG